MAEENKSEAPKAANHQQRTSMIKSQLLELLKSADIDDNDIDTTDFAVNASLSSIEIGNNIEDIDRSSQINSQYDKQILLEEAAMIHRLHAWIQKTGKPAIKRSNELQLQCEQQEQELANTNEQLTALHDEVSKTNKEKSELQSKYDALLSQQQELQRSLNELQLSHNTTVDQQIQAQNEQQSDQLKEYETKMDTLNRTNTDLVHENENLTKLNTQYEEQHNLLSTKVTTKEEQIDELTNDRDAWEAKYNQTQQDLLDRLQEINQLRSENANYKQQLDVIQQTNPELIANNVNQLGNLKTIRGANLFPTDSDGNLMLESEPNVIGKHEKTESGVGVLGFYQPSTTNVFQGIYANQSTASIHGGKHQSRDSVDDAAFLQEGMFDLQKRIKDEKERHEAEMEAKEAELEKEKSERIDRENDIKELREEIDKLKEQQAEQQQNGCNGCSCLTM